MTIYQDEIPRNIFQKLFGIEPKIKPLIAKRDIVCYKLYHLSDIPGVVISPFRNTMHIIGKEQPPVEITHKVVTWLDELTQIIIECGYHSYIKNDGYQYYPTDHVVKKCIIPKGSTYYIGNQHGQVRNAYVSNQLIIL
jgi:hypothetical protein